ncbi:MAG: hypothetical protein AAFO61_13205 [Pseudomonadota bacterium]
MADEEREAREGHEYVDFESPEAYEQAKKLVLANGTSLSDHVLAEPENTPEGKFTIEMAEQDAVAIRDAMAITPAELAEIERDQAIAHIHAEHAETLRRLTGNATIEERDTWTRQQRWAEAHLAGDAKYADLLAGLLTPPEREAAGESAANTMAQKIKAKVDFTDLLISKAGGTKREAEKMLESLGTAAEIRAFRTGLAATKAQREADFAAQIAQLA